MSNIINIHIYLIVISCSRVSRRGVVFPLNAVRCMLYPRNFRDIACSVAELNAFYCSQTEELKICHSLEWESSTQPLRLHLISALYCCATMAFIFMHE